MIATIESTNPVRLILFLYLQFPNIVPCATCRMCNSHADVWWWFQVSLVQMSPLSCHSSPCFTGRFFTSPQLNSKSHWIYLQNSLHFHLLIISTTNTGFFPLGCAEIVGAPLVCLCFLVKFVLWSIFRLVGKLNIKHSVPIPSASLLLFHLISLPWTLNIAMVFFLLMIFLE